MSYPDNKTVFVRKLAPFLTKLLRVTPVGYPFHFHTSALVFYLNMGVHLFQPITEAVSAKGIYNKQ
jgi:hypothetical protein